MKRHFTYFSSDIAGIERPDMFDFPFYYTPHPLAVIAAKELQAYLSIQSDWYHDFGMESDSPPQACGKMFGVLVVESPEGELGYLKAFSGKMAQTNVLDPFVPPVFDNLVEGDFYKEGEAEVNRINCRVEELESSVEYQSLKSKVESHKTTAHARIVERKKEIKAAKKARDQRRELARNASEEEKLSLEEELRKESIALNAGLKRLKDSLDAELSKWQEALDSIEVELAQLKEERRDKSIALQRRIFEQFQFLNANGEYASLFNIFQSARNESPPAGAGDCAAPKLLHYAYQNNFKPLCMAEFWWGRPPRNEVRKHLKYYTSCRGKCEPILGHMLKGLKVGENPMHLPPEESKEIEILYEDPHLVAIHKPHEFLSVPGKTVEDSVWTRMKTRYPQATGPLIVHRLDMSTSGLLLIPLTQKAHKRLQTQFRRRTVHKTYVAILEGQVMEDEGVIDLPMRVDLNDRPRQLVCHEYGKHAVTKFKVLERRKDTTLVQFHPITGRTHQLRVHAAHVDGLDAPIKGDDLYGESADRLYLHAAKIAFEHPITREKMELETKVDW